MQYAPTRVRTKFGGFHISPHEYAKNAPDFTLPNKDAPKTRPVLDPNPWRRTFSGRMLLRPYTGTCKNCPVLGLNLRRGTFSGRMQYAPTRVRAKFDGFHISASGYAKNAPRFRPRPSARDILGRMLLRPYTGTRKICPVSHFPTRIRQKRTRFYLSQ